MTSLNLTVNGQPYTIEAEEDMPLLWALRDLIGLTGTKFGCGQGLCGSCTVHVDGQAVRSCTTTAASVVGKAITTIEGLSVDGGHPIQQAWMQENVSQCGYCQPGQIMAAAALLANNPNPSDAEIAETMSDLLCRCGTYQRIHKAIRRVTEGGAA